MTRFCGHSLLVVLITCALALGQYKVLYNFGSNPLDGNTPNGALALDGRGNLYGTTSFGGASCEDCGVAFELSPSGRGAWTESIIHNFGSSGDGVSPDGGVVFDQSGNLYGTTLHGGSHNAGVVFELSAPVSGSNWTETILWNFGDGGPHDAALGVGELALDESGDLYGATLAGGVGYGTVFELTPSQNGWVESVLYEFCTAYPMCPDGVQPMAGPILDDQGNLYGTTWLGGAAQGEGWGVVYQLSPSSGGTWAETTLHQFSRQTGGRPVSPVTFDDKGNFYGTISQGARHGCGGLFKMTPSGNGWVESAMPFNGEDGCVPQGGVFVDSLRQNVFGTSKSGGRFNGGAAFQVGSRGVKVIHSFCSQASCPDGDQPTGSLTVIGTTGYGTTLEGGTSSACGQLGCGVVFQISR